MNLTLFPVAAFLLLLSGIAVPAHAAGPQETSAALMGVLFGSWGMAPNGLPLATSPAVASQRFARGVARLCGDVVSPGARPGFCATQLTRRVVSVSRSLGAKRYRTRFGAASRAYFAAGPPAVAARFGLDLARS